MKQANELHEELMSSIGRHWMWFLGLGILSLVLGSIGLVMTGAMTIGTLVYFGVCLIAVGLAEILHGMSSRRWKILGRIVLGLLFVGGGVATIRNPLAASLSLTLFLGYMLVAVGAFRVVDALVYRVGQWGFRLLHGVVTAVLGGLVVSAWPVSAVWFIGMAVSIELVLHGWHSIALAVVAKRYACHPGHGLPPTEAPMTV